MKKKLFACVITFHIAKVLGNITLRMEEILFWTKLFQYKDSLEYFTFLFPFKTNIMVLLYSIFIGILYGFFLLWSVLRNLRKKQLNIIWLRVCITIYVSCFIYMYLENTELRNVFLLGLLTDDEIGGLCCGLYYCYTWSNLIYVKFNLW